MTLVEAIENNLYAFPPFHAWSRAEGYDGPDLLWTISDIPAAYFNRVGRANLREEDADAAIAAAIARARAKNVPLMWWVGPSSRPAGLGQRLVSHGFRQTADLSGMAAELKARQAGSPVPGLHIERVRDRERLRLWNTGFLMDFSEERYAFYAEHFDSSFRHYIGSIDGARVATSTLFFGGGIAGIYSVYTLEEMRGRGIGTALTQAAMNDAHELGHRHAVLVARPDASGLYARLGFAEHGRFGTYLSER